MGYYRVDFGSYSLCHSDKCKYFNYFEFNEKKYPIGAYVKLTDRGMSELFRNHGYNYVKGDFRLVDYYITEGGAEEWKYIIGHLHNSTIPVLHSTRIKPEEIVDEVMCNEIDETARAPGELEITFKEPNYSPRDWDVGGVMLGWFIMAIVWIGAFILKDWWIRFAIQICAGWYFGSWRERKMNEAITKQKFKE